MNIALKRNDYTFEEWLEMDDNEKIEIRLFWIKE